MLELATNQSRRPTPPAVTVLATVLVCVPILALAQFIAHARADELDAWLFAYYGREMLSGRRLYTDLWDNKPPGIFWLNALSLWLSGGSLTGIRVLCALASSGAAAAVFAAAKRLYGWSAAGIATILAALYLNVWLYHVGCNRPNTFFVATELACFALYCLAVTGTRRQRIALVAAGLCGGLGLCLKQSALAMTAAVILHTLYLWAGRRVTFREAVFRGAFFCAGWCSAVALAAIAILITSDANLAWYGVVGFNRLYFLPGAGASLMPHFLHLEPHIRMLGLPAILACATLIQPLLRRFVGRAAEQDDDPLGTRPEGLLFLLWAWMLCAMYLALVGPHRRLPYFGVALPPLVMLSAHGVYLLLRSGRRISQTRPAYHVVVGVLWFGYMMIFPLHQQLVEAGKHYYHRFIEEPDASYVEKVDLIRSLTEPDETLFVFGYAPKLYWDADRHSAIRYIGTEKAGELGPYGQLLFDEITALLIESPPDAIVVHPKDLRRSLSGFGGLNMSKIADWIEAHYDRPEGGRPTDLWLRRD